MRFIKLAFISFIVFFFIVTAISLLIPSHIRISRAVNVKAPHDSLVHLISNRQQWPRWHPIFQQDSVQQQLEKNKITITPLAVTDTLITVQWQQAGRRPVSNGWQLHSFPGADSTAVQWYMDFNLRWYPWQKFSALFYEKTYGTMMERGLYNLREKVQATDTTQTF